MGKSHSGCLNVAVLQLQVQYDLNMQPGMLEGWEKRKKNWTKLLNFKIIFKFQ
jgi:hypothetical protein